ncbi:response regulator [Paenibacillus sp. F411]|uniref:response regulator n=1 Tax=Paenibacillus sp. F411 TaxID=2820239 RepID=UPI001AAEAB20|nr:response regulator [Paenibacillus sp. F411]MBO2943539.1 response regulator [Paenibacillus sp. F411]
MYKVLLADDEILDLEGMKQFIPWESLGMTVVAGVNNGFAACEVLEREKIDVLVSDIRMPNMSGLELAQKALELQEQLQIIFVSGYQDFSYVKQAMALQACSYVLKPMDDSELIEALGKVRLKLDHLRRRQETETAYQKAIPVVKHQYLLQLLQQPLHRVPREAMNPQYRFQRIAWPVRAGLFELDDAALLLNHVEKEERLRLIEDVHLRLQQLLLRKGLEYICTMQPHRTAVLLPAEASAEDFDFIREQLAEEFPFTLTIGTGEPAHHLQELHASYEQAVTALEYKMFRGKGQWINFTDIPREEMQHAATLDLRLDALMQAMTSYNLVSIHDELEQMAVLVSGMRSRFTVRNLSLYILMKLNDHLHTMQEDLFQMLGLELAKLDVLLQFETIDDIFSWLRRKVFEISEQLHNRKSSKNGRLVQEMVDDVRQRLHESITLRDVANRFSFSPNYLGVLFKEETGHNFSDYVIGLRMDHAKSLLTGTKLKIYEVAAQCGYQYLPYFSRQFKETFGMTPLDYRRQHS